MKGGDMFEKRSFAIILSTVILISAVSYIAFRPTRAEGVIDHKTITGSRDSMSYTIVIITDTGVIVEDEEFEEDFMSFTTINETLAHRLDSWYDEIKYHISVRTGDETRAYFVNRIDFNKVDINCIIIFIILRFKTNTIRILKILHARRC
jgi:hypothetical protein